MGYISTPPDDVYTQEEIEEIKKEQTIEQKQQVAKRNYERYSRMSEHALDDENREKYRIKAEEWLKEYEKYHKQTKKFLGKSEYDRKQFEKYCKVLGDDAPKSFAEFKEMKYNKVEK